MHGSAFSNSGKIQAPGGTTLGFSDRALAASACSIDGRMGHRAERSGAQPDSAGDDDARAAVRDQHANNEHRHPDLDGSGLQVGLAESGQQPDLGNEPRPAADRCQHGTDRHRQLHGAGADQQWFLQFPVATYPGGRGLVRPQVEQPPDPGGTCQRGSERATDRSGHWRNRCCTSQFCPDCECGR